ncbi:nuclear membrane fusion protein Kar5 [Aspergillus luchuensis]|uniref:Nuclear membrane fusion protein Kar5 n=1 Tax=Aspergillus kawachii TaxID=1069201 RepID=A0A146FQA1_ASPKA|nr:nuclear membrane fusion protein Kar5 [Aspergillus luchuensis]
MRSKLVVSMEETEIHFKARLENLILDMGVHLGSILEPVVSTIRNLHGSTASLDKNIANAAEDVKNLRHILKLVEDEGTAWGQQQAVTRLQDALAMSDLVSDVQGDMEKLSGTVTNFDSALRLSNLETALSGSQVIAEDLRSAQLGQNELQEHLLTNMRTSQALVDKTTAAAANLQTIVDDTVKRYQEVPASRRLLAIYIHSSRRHQSQPPQQTSPVHTQTAFAAGAGIWGCGILPQSATFEARLAGLISPRDIAVDGAGGGCTL